MRGADSGELKEPRVTWDPDPLRGRVNFGDGPPTEQHWEPLLWCKTAESIEMPFEWLTQVGPRNHVLYGVKVGRIHSPPRGVIRRRCGLLSKFFDPLFNWSSVLELRHVALGSRKSFDDNCINNHIVSKEGRK